MRTTRALIPSTIGGLLNVAAVILLYARIEYPLLGPNTTTAFAALGAFLLGFVAVFVTARTFLLTPVAIFFLVLGGTIFLEFTSPSPEWSELEGFLIVEGPTYVLDYANSWYVWIGVLLVYGILEHAVRTAVGGNNTRFRGLPNRPSSRSTSVAAVGGILLGLVTTLLVLEAGIDPVWTAVVVFLFATAVTVVPLLAVVHHGAFVPAALFTLVVPYLLAIEVYTTTDSPIHFLLLGPFAVLLVLVWGLEVVLRSRLRGGRGLRGTVS